jgi:hypothetical protein
MALGLPGKLIISVFPGIGQEILQFGRLMVFVFCASNRMRSVRRQRADWHETKKQACHASTHTHLQTQRTDAKESPLGLLVP